MRLTIVHNCFLSFHYINAYLRFVLNRGREGLNRGREGRTPVRPRRHLSPHIKACFGARDDCINDLFALRTQSRSGRALSRAVTFVAAASCPIAVGRGSIAVGRGALQCDRGDICRRMSKHVFARRSCLYWFAIRTQSRSGGALSRATAASTDAAYQGVFYATIMSILVCAFRSIAVGRGALQCDRGID